MKVLVACEFSGIVRDAFIARGHDAISCDVLPSERPGPHLEMPIELVRTTDYDLMIAHPPCTYLTNAGVRWLYTGGSAFPDATFDEARYKLMTQAALFFLDLLHADVPMIAVENPVMHGYAGIRKADQIIQPWQFGHGEVKGTGLWLKNLPPLVPTNIVDGRTPRVHYASPGPNRWKERSRTLQGIADAMADQWGTL